MFQKILIANRGEIACRVMRTARRMGLATVAVYSDADANAPHVAMADEAVRLGPAPASQSYLRADLILKAARDTGADAIHPGYGFLSERESFARACEVAGIAFVGPSAGAIAAMGDKIQSKKLAAAAGVNVVPGHLGEIETVDEAARIAGEIGYPVMMKASAGGGGKGMRLAWSEAELREGFDAVRREGKASFGDDRVFVERFIESPRHIEIQVLGDRHGTVLHLGERECSIQRRHQKVVEEAPSPFVSPAMRRAMGEQAVALAKAVGYHSAGTVELIVSGADPTGASFYFLEMNTRLQVEHPVTEFVTGLDLVEQMIRVAAGEKLSFGQDEVRLDGWAIETRVYAEDPYRGFLPSTGRLTRYRPPAQGGGVRVDDGVAEGSEISPFYDPMIAKLVTHGATRQEAIERQGEALDRFELEGVGNNVDFLAALMRHERFLEGRLTTGFIAEEYPDGFAGAPASRETLACLAGTAAVLQTRLGQRARQIGGQLGPGLRPPQRWRVTIADAVHDVDVLPGTVRIDGAERPLQVDWDVGTSLCVARYGDATLAIRVRRERGRWRFTTQGASHLVSVLAPRVAELSRHMIEHSAPDLSRFLLCPMPGTVTAVHVSEGQRVAAGQSLATVEAMKMENVLRAGKAATVEAIRVAPGDALLVDAVILEFQDDQPSRAG
ncbi:acetyl/propionyl/methylcrotonyl-CoA carboxylase subunit alpha [Aureimonas sp. AU4]|uniref:acetyl-CoA carboxylase biotin carboxylase subunit n=1 Tax=Aureimonas sp. AU4 TaxID=1638163 RepID=UPI000783C2B7|nr:acetyl/propionyl/methylcrotonyl-CoA carboxylase subunit alpha [Aureimonas sp. AU4]